MRFIEGADGILYAPAKGEPPQAPPGYVQDVHDKYRYNINLPKCAKRTSKIIQRKCCGPLKVTLCGKERITLRDCVKCNLLGNNGLFTLSNGETLDFPEEIYLVGKGPSMDTFTFPQDAKIVGINEVALLIDCWGAIAIDRKPIINYRDKGLNPKTIVFKRVEHTHSLFDREYIWTIGKETKTPQCTASAAVQIFKFLGLKKLHLVGFDSKQGNYDCAQSIVENNYEGQNYINVLRDFEETLKTLDLEVIWEC